MNVLLCEQEINVLESGLAKLGTENLLPYDHLKAALALIRKSLQFMSDHLVKQPLASVDEAIQYGKMLLPKLYARYIYHQEWYAIITTLPVNRPKKIRAFWSDELRTVHRFPSRYALQHAYFKLNSSELDRMLFIKGDQGSALMPEVPESDPIFPTTCSYLFAKFRAFEMLADAIIKAMGKQIPMVHAPVTARKPKRAMRWTGDSINLAEIAFGIHDTGQLNDGQATLEDIFGWLEDELQVSMGRPTRRFDSLYDRKFTSPTDYLEQMMRAIQQRIDKKNAYDPEAEEEKRRRKERRAKRAAQKRSDGNGDKNNAGN